MHLNLLDTQIYDDKYEIKFRFGIDKLTPDMKLYQRGKHRLSLLYHQLAYKENISGDCSLEMKTAQPQLTGKGLIVSACATKLQL